MEQPIKLTGNLRIDRSLLLNEVSNSELFKYCKTKKYRDICDNDFWRERYFLTTGENNPLFQKRNDPKINWFIVYKNAWEDTRLYTTENGKNPMEFFDSLKIHLAYSNILQNSYYYDGDDYVTLENAPRFILNNLYFLRLAPENVRVYFSDDENDYIDIFSSNFDNGYLTPLSLIQQLQERLDYAPLVINGFIPQDNGYLLDAEDDIEAIKQMAGGEMEFTEASENGNVEGIERDEDGDLEVNEEEYEDQREILPMEITE